MFKNKTVFITGGARGIGKAIGLKLAAQGANIVITGKSTEPHPKLEGTIFTSAQEMRDAGGDGLGIGMDVRDENQVKSALEKAAAHFGGIDIAVGRMLVSTNTQAEEMINKVFDMGETLGCFGYIAMIAGLPALFATCGLPCNDGRGQCWLWQERAYRYE